ncbi:FAD-binding type 2 [Penicillium macrosclerotiorum]|uniref:FAD-binding type 2 n=1 Tax=Penicillium macrosclerotiorum TaxID=303699 RepID=UPI0025490717|nr:FAD-binding type 2 [Penicillium macrosclerotiorum]KAJ5698965.1 FAD-binding type 2 [Penicillium macrosclerotiorum]
MDVACLLSILQLTPEKVAAVEPILSQFHALKDCEKNDRRLATTETVFPLVFGEDASVRTDPHFSERNNTVWSLNCQLTPGVIVVPRTSEDVGKVLALCRGLDVKFSVRGGGHLQNPGFTSNEDGVVISMKNFKAVTVSEDQSKAEIGAGLTWLEVYRELEPHGVAVTGGRVPSVGVPGLLLGGGLSFQKGKYGLSCNGVVEYEIVLADSTIVKANANENKDLFWALRGGGSNFGIVTKFTMTTVSNKVWAEGRVFAPTENNKLFEALMRFHQDAEKDTNASLIFNSVQEATLLVFIYAEHADKRPAVFDAFEGVDFVAQMVPGNNYTIFQIVNGFESVTATEPKNHDMRTMSSLPDLEVYNAASECRYQQEEVIKDIPGAKITFTLQPISSNAIRTTNAGAGSPLGITAKAHQWFLLMTEWTNQEDEATVRDAARKIIDAAEVVAKKNGTFLDFKYANYSSRDQDPQSTYGDTNLAKLKDVARKVDPSGVFQNLQHGGWLVSRTGNKE